MSKPDKTAPDSPATPEAPALATPTGIPRNVVPVASVEFGFDPGGLNISLEWNAAVGLTLQLQSADSMVNGAPNWQNFGGPWVSSGGAAVTSSNRIAWQLLST